MSKPTKEQYAFKKMMIEFLKSHLSIEVEQESKMYGGQTVTIELKVAGEPISAGWIELEAVD